MCTDGSSRRKRAPFPVGGRRDELSGRGGGGGRPRPPAPCGRQAGAAPSSCLRPGTPEAEAAADALLMPAKACSLRLARALCQAAEAAPAEVAAGLRGAAEALRLSCAYTTETALRRRHYRMLPLSPVSGRIPGEQAAPHASPLSWLSQRLPHDLEALARDLGMTQRQAQVWIAYARGDTLAEIARSLGISVAVAHRHLARAQERARQSWLAAYAESLRA
ncbi:MAG: hypothetical protein GX774_11240 [Armatimonadetes bacterium]|nr:hypothetical protein [Armatimonadota bacterium]